MQDILGLLPLLMVLGLIWAWVRHRQARPRVAMPAPLAPDLQRADANPRYQGPAGFLRRHFAGDYGLARSYWVNTLLVAAVLAALIAALALVGDRPVRVGSALFLLAQVLIFLTWLWSVVGTWRSAGKHESRGGRRGWAVLVQLLIVLGALRIVGDYASKAHLFAAHWRVAMGAQTGGATTFKVRPDGRSIELSGGINDGADDQLQESLQKAPSVRTLVLRSPGGWVREGVRLARTVRDKRLDTYVEGECDSACTIVFLAGRDRAMDPAARLGFHSSHRIGESEGDGTLMDGAYAQAHLPSWFESRVGQTSPQAMWYPTQQELLSAGVLTRLSDGGETASMASSIRSREELDREFRKVDVFAALGERNPATLNAIVDGAWEQIRHGAVDAEVIARAREQLDATLPRYLATADDPTVAAMAQLVHDQLSHLEQDGHTTECVHLAYAEGPVAAAARFFPPRMVQRERSLYASAIRTSDDVAHPTRVTPADTQRVMQAMRRTMTRDQIALFANAQLRAQRPEEACHAAVLLYEGILSRDTPQRAAAMRSLLRYAMKT